MRILVTGGAGFIGSHTVDALVAAGAHEVAVIDDLSAGKRDQVNPGARFHQADIRDGAEVGRIIAREQPEVMVHFAAQMDVRRSVADPAFDAQVNLVGFLNLMEAARRHGLRRVVFSSTGGAIYGEQDAFPADESHPCRPVSPYGVAKFSTESYLFFYKAQYGIDYAAMRYANVYGPRHRMGRREWSRFSAGGSSKAGRPRFSATASRRGTTFTSATLCGPTWRRCPHR